jgi:DNA-binding LytR/AlgR family response regulator
MQTAFFIRIDGKLESISFDDVLYISAKNNYCEIVTITKRKYLVYVTMSCMEQKLPRDLFIRVHRSYIISVKKINWLNCNKMAIEGQVIPVSKEGHREVLQRILIICPEGENNSKQENTTMSPDPKVKKARARNKKGNNEY